LAGTLATTFFGLLAIYFYMRGKKSRGLTYKISPVRTQIVRAGAASRLSVIHDGREIKTDITAVHLAIWNQGRESIRQGDMLRPLIIQTADHAPILEASIRMVTHDVIGLRLDESTCVLGQLGVSWDILAQFFQIAPFADKYPVGEGIEPAHLNPTYARWTEFSERGRLPYTPRHSFLFRL